MSDFYSILKQSIVDRGLSTPAQREEVYGQARTAIIRKLWSYDPPLAEDEIDARIGAFDRTVERIETDLAATFARPAAPARASRPPANAPAEAYDEEADFVPAVPARKMVTAAPVPASARMPARPARRHDPLAERSAAIEEALRGDYAAADARAAELAPAYEAEEQAEEEAWDQGDGHADAFPDDADFAEDDEYEAPRERAAALEAHPAARSWKERIPSPKAGWADMPERSKVRMLAGLIAALGIILIAAGIYVGTSLLASHPGGEVAGPPGGSAEAIQSFTLFDGSDPTVFEASPSNPVRFDRDGDGSGLARVTSSAGSPGVRINIGPGIASRLAGQPVRVTVVARAAKENGAANMRFAYQSGVALSHWQAANLSGDNTSYALVWRVPKMQTDPNGDYVLIEPGIPGDGTSADIRSVRVDLLAREPG